MARPSGFKKGLYFGSLLLVHGLQGQWMSRVFHAIGGAHQLDDYVPGNFVKYPALKHAQAPEILLPRLPGILRLLQRTCISSGSDCGTQTGSY